MRDRRLPVSESYRFLFDGERIAAFRSLLPGSFVTLIVCLIGLRPCFVPLYFVLSSFSSACFPVFFLFLPTLLILFLMTHEHVLWCFHTFVALSASILNVLATVPNVAPKLYAPIRNYCSICFPHRKVGFILGWRCLSYCPLCCWCRLWL